MAKKIVGYIKLQVPAGKANPSPPIGPALGQRGLNIMDFCKAVQRPHRRNMEPGTPMPMVITVYQRQARFTFVTKTPPATYFIKQAVGVDNRAPRRRAAAWPARSRGRRCARSPRRR